MSASSCDAEKLKIRRDGGNETETRGYGDACGGVWRNVHSVEVCSQAVSFFVGAFRRTMTSVAVKMFSHLI